jgi:hypothetical protein
MRYSWIPPKRSRGVPWAREVASVTRGLPKTSRIPTGGWRSFGAVPSNTYAASPIGDTGYWSGLGQQGGTTTPTATQPSATAQIIGSLGTAAAAIYSTWSQQQVAQTALRRGVAPPPPPPPPGAPAPAAQTAALQAGGGGGIPTWAMIAGGVGLAAVAGFAMMKKRR